MAAYAGPKIVEVERITAGLSGRIGAVMRNIREMIKNGTAIELFAEDDPALNQPVHLSLSPAVERAVNRAQAENPHVDLDRSPVAASASPSPVDTGGTDEASLTALGNKTRLATLMSNTRQTETDKAEIRKLYQQVHGEEAMETIDWARRANVARRF